MSEEKTNLTAIWNKAVANAGGQRNTLNNFQNIAREFESIAGKEGYSKEVINNYANENYNSTARFMVQ